MLHVIEYRLQKHAWIDKGRVQIFLITSHEPEIMDNNEQPDPAT